MTDNNLPVFDYWKMTKEEIHDFLKANATAEEIACFRAAAFVPTPQKVRVPYMVISEDGTTTQKYVRRKQKDGTYKSFPKTVSVPVKGGKIEYKYIHRAAISWFCKTYVDIPTPKAIMKNRHKESTNDKITAKDLFADLWGTEDNKHD